MDYSQTLEIGGSKINGAVTVSYEELCLILTKISFSSVFLGAVGGLCRCLYNNKGITYGIKAVLLGAILSMVLSPIISYRFPQDMVPFLLFFIGYCGFQGLDFIGNLFRTFIENHFEEYATKVLSILKLHKE